ncbi:hypothetical protein IC619_013890 [Hazenella sp. IB182353]|uniref:hypothetical protein n=1 Tax=Polycladospora coralii TaxID=2771432 RepID=UPI001746D0AB|nr:hypothetical protein [Polycladospora coralii]MBS7531575.1 hypothetical protein [Polycladospora coralii]
MNLPNLFNKIIAHPDLVEILTWPFDFEVIKPYAISEEPDLKVREVATVIAKDGTGGIFALWGEGQQVDNCPIVYIGSEGEAGMIAHNFHECISLTTQHPYWRDMLKYSGGGQLKEMYKVLSLLEVELLEEEPDIELMRERLISTLQLNIEMDLVEQLFYAVSSKIDLQLTTIDNQKFDSLFNSFTVNDNPLWKNS